MRRLLSLVLAPLLLAGVLTACGSSPAEEAEEKGLPSVSGAYGDKPKVTKQKGEKAGKKLQTAVLEEGEGKKVAKGDLLVADYLGQNYRSAKVFDNSYDRGAPAAFPIGIGEVIPGWDKGLVGTRIGSRVLMVIPPKDGYGAQGNKQAGIKGTDSLVFVVDIIASYAKGTVPLGKATAVTGVPADLPKVVGPIGQKPRITVAKGLTPPTKNTITVLAKGDGPKVVKGKLVIVHYDAVSWAGQALSSSYGKAPQGVQVNTGQPSPFDLLEGVPVGSRVLLTLPAQQGGDPKKDSVAVVIDVLTEHGPAKKES